MTILYTEMNPFIDSACAPLGPRDTSDDIKEALFEPRGGEFSFPTNHKFKNITYYKGNIFFLLWHVSSSPQSTPFFSVLCSFLLFPLIIRKIRISIFFPLPLRLYNICIWTPKPCPVTLLFSFLSYPTSQVLL